MRAKFALFFAMTLIIAIAISACAGTTPNPPAGSTTSDPVMPRLIDGNWWADTTGTVPTNIVDQLNKESKAINEMGFQLGGAFFANSASDGIQVATKFGNENGIGFKEKDNGIAIVLFLEKKGGDGYAPAISVATGKGIEGLLNDAKVGRFLDQTYVPLRKEGKWQEGLLSFVQYTHRYLSNPQADEFKEVPPDTSGTIQILLICLALLVIFILLDFAFLGGQVTGAILSGTTSGSGSSGDSSGDGGFSGGGGGFSGGGASR